MNLEETKYDAFISYRHSELDQFAAITLHKELESFRLPKAIQNQLQKKGIQKKKIERVFRDRDELPITNNLADPITNALRNSDFLLVICSPRIRESLWCRKEIETFISMHGRENVFAVLIEGEPSESFPEELLYEEKKIVDENGVEQIERVPIEPLAADIRGKDKKEMRKKIKEEIVRLAAPMFGCSYDDLKQRHKERLMRRIITTACAASVVFGSFGLISTTMAIKIQKQSEQIEVQYQEALKTNAKQMAEDAFDYIEKGDMERAVKTAYDALTQVEGVDMPYTADAEYALSTALQTYRNGYQIRAQRLLEMDSAINFCKMSPNFDTLLMVDSFGNLSVYNPLTGEKLYSVEVGYIISPSEEKVCFVGNTKIAYAIEEGFALYNLETQELQEFEAEWLDALWSDNTGEYLVVNHEVQGEEMLTIYDTKTMKPAFEVQAEDGEVFGLECKFSGETPGLLAVEYETAEDQYGLILIDTEKQTSVRIETLFKSIKDIRFAEEEIYYSGLFYFDMNRIEGGLYCADLSGNVKWEHLVDGGPEHIIVYGAESKDKLAYSKYSTLVVLNKEDGSLMSQIDFGSDIINYWGYTGMDELFVMTRDGNYYYYSPVTDSAVQNEGKFITNSDNIKIFDIGANFYVSIAHMSNVAAIYQSSIGNDVNLLLESDVALTDTKISPDGEYIVYMAAEGNYNRLLTYKVSDGSLVSEIVLENSISEFDINADGEVVALTSFTVERYELENGVLIQSEELETTYDKKLLNHGQTYLTSDSDSVFIKDVKSGKVINEVSDIRVVGDGQLASAVDETGTYYAFCDGESKKIVIGSFEGAFSMEIPSNVNSIKELALAPQAKAIFVTYLDEKVEAYDITTGNLLITYGILEGGVEKITELTKINGIALETVYGAYLVNEQLEIIAFIQGYSDYSEKNDSFILENTYSVYEAKRHQLDDLLNSAQSYLAE